MIAASDLKPGDRIKVHDWPRTRGQVYTVSRIDPAKGGAVYTWDSEMRYRAFPLANVVKVKR